MLSDKLNFSHGKLQLKIKLKQASIQMKNVSWEGFLLYSLGFCFFSPTRNYQSVRRASRPRSQQSGQESRSRLAQLHTQSSLYFQIFVHYSHDNKWFQWHHLNYSDKEKNRGAATFTSRIKDLKDSHEKHPLSTFDWSRYWTFLSLCSLQEGM